MKRQYKAGSLDKNVFDSITNLRKGNELKYEIIGLLESLSTFDTLSEIVLEKPNTIHSLWAVANNIITRGCPIATKKLYPSIVISNIIQTGAFNSKAPIFLSVCRYSPTEAQKADTITNTFFRNGSPNRTKI